MNAQYWIEKLALTAHPEGGYFRETYRSAEQIDAAQLPKRFGGPRNFSTAIYFLLEGHQISALHRIKSDELWHYHTGGRLDIHLIHPAGTHETVTLGAEADRGDVFQAVIPAGCWFGAKLKNTSSFILASCTVAPGFDYSDFEMADRRTLLAQYPKHRTIIELLTRPS